MIQVFKYGFSKGRLVVHVSGDEPALKIIPKLEEIFKDPRWKAGETVIVGFTADETIDSVEDTWELTKTIAKSQPAKIVIIGYGEPAIENLRVGERMLKVQGIDAKYFEEDLDQMLKYADKEVKD